MIGGEIEANHDFLNISDPSGKVLAELTGDLHDELLVDGNCIIAHFTSNGSVTKDGFAITVEDNNGRIPSIWRKMPYENNEDETRQLCLDGVEKVGIILRGEIEANYDFLIITDNSGKEIAKLTGRLDNIIDLEEGNCITVHFTSNGSVTKEGFNIFLARNIGPIIH